ncbi:MAG: polysaccharide deacetylase family protein [Thermovenabulum sp.]|uniref:polysaccharide deacetylase family protein n=1 Tax=Thermovenabulum sp. TaxID=3100335 RepID=UPI003C7E30FC
MKVIIYKLPRYFLKIILVLLLIFLWTIVKTEVLFYKSIETTNPIYEFSTEKKAVAFTCNVAWGNEYLPNMLKVFEKNDIKITFFIEGKWAEKYPELVKTIKNKGHEIGNHGYSHAHHAKLNLNENKEEILKCEQVLFKIINEKTRLFAPPYGEFSKETIKAADELGYKVIMWSIDTLDWKNPGAQYIINKVTKKADNGKIILMHPTKDIIEALPIMIEKLKAKGFDIVPVGELLK